MLRIRSGGIPVYPVLLETSFLIGYSPRSGARLRSCLRISSGRAPSLKTTGKVSWPVTLPLMRCFVMVFRIDLRLSVGSLIVTPQEYTVRIE